MTEPMVSSHAWDLAICAAVLVCLLSLLIGICWGAWRDRS